MGYKELIRIVDFISVYKKDGLELCIEDVNDKYLLRLKKTISIIL